MRQGWRDSNSQHTDLESPNYWLLVTGYWLLVTGYSNRVGDITHCFK